MSFNALPGFRTVLLAVAWLAMSPAHADLVWHWKDRFSPDEKAKLTRWITATAAGIETLVAPYPFDVHINFYRAKRQGSPVPWANTRRGHEQGVNFHVNAEHSLEAFLDDWTAPHELSHLLLPYLGRSHSWFAEGFASYMQYQVMIAMNVLDHREMLSRYRTRIEKAERQYDYDDIPFAAAAARLLQQREYKTMYWGGAVYFLQVQKQLQQDGQSLTSVLRQFVRCCRVATRDLDSLVGELDRIAGRPVFREQLTKMQEQPGFPDNSDIWADAYEK